MHTSGQGAREQALETLLQVLVERRSLDLALGHAGDGPDGADGAGGGAPDDRGGAQECGSTDAPAAADPRDRALARELSFGVLRWLERLRATAGRLLRRPFKPRDLDVELSLLIGLYQLDYTRMPAHAAVSSAVELTRLRGKTWARGVVNACLRRYQREREALIAPLAGTARFDHSHPGWLAERIGADWPSQRDRILAANQDRAPMSLRVNRRHSPAAAYRAHLAAAGIAASPGRHAPDCLRLDAPVAARSLPGFAAGAVSVQDEAAQLAGPLLAPEPGERVLDACAAPGGKSAHLLEVEPGIGELVCVDASEPRVARLRAGLARVAPAREVTIVTAEAQRPECWWDGQPFDAILLDAPCSATGVIRRHPDIKALRSPGGVEAAARGQRELLGRLWPLLAPGGRLLYATCSILHAENDAVVHSLLREAADARAAPIEAEWGIATDLGRQILPGGTDDMDGFYYALLEKLCV